MVATYTIAGRQIGSHQLAMGVLGAVFSGAYFATRGGGSKATAAAQSLPAINASSKDEETFIKEFLESADKKH